MTPKIYINGKFYDKADAKISVYDHGLLYGDGVFEGIRVYNGRVFKLKEHVDRLFESAQAIKLEIPLSREQMRKAIPMGRLGTVDEIADIILWLASDEASYVTAALLDARGGI